MLNKLRWWVAHCHSGVYILLSLQVAQVIPLLYYQMTISFVAVSYIFFIKHGSKSIYHLCHFLPDCNKVIEQTWKLYWFWVIWSIQVTSVLVDIS